MINLEGLNPLPEIGGVSADVDHIANAQCTGLETQRRDRQVTVIVGDDARYASPADPVGQAGSVLMRRLWEISERQCAA